MTGCLIVCIERATRLVKSQQSAGMFIDMGPFSLEVAWKVQSSFGLQDGDFQPCLERAALGLQCLELKDPSCSKPVRVHPCCLRCFLIVSLCLGLVLSMKTLLKDQFHVLTEFKAQTYNSSEIVLGETTNTELNFHCEENQLDNGLCALLRRRL